MPTYAYHHHESGKTWVRLWSDSASWDEPISDYDLVFNLTNGDCTYRHKQSRVEYPFKDSE